MDRNRLLGVIFLFLVVSNVSDAIRRLDEAPQVNNSTAQHQVSKLPDSGSSDEKPDPKPEGVVKSDENDKEKEKMEDLKVPDNSSVVGSQVPQNSSADDSQAVTNSPVIDSQTPVDSRTAPANSSVVDTKGLNDTSSVSVSSPNGQNDTNPVSQPPAKKTDGDKLDQEANRKDGDVDKPSPEQKIAETCDGQSHRCTDGSLEACIQNFETGFKDLSILVRNNGKKTMKVILDVPASVQSSSKELEIPKHQTEKMNISIDVSKGSNIIFKAGSRECKLIVAAVASEPNFFLRLPSFDKLATPVNGAYLVIIAGVVLGFTWACFKCRKSKRHDGIPYQELEMGLPESVSATNVETAEGWDQGWDDDWDDDHAVKSPAGNAAAGSISANGLTARSATNKDGWDNDWDD